MERFRRDLAAAGVDVKDRVVLSLPDGHVQAAVMLAALRAAVVTPVSPALPLPEAAAILGKIAPRAVIVGAMVETAFREAAVAAGNALLEVDATLAVFADAFSYRPRVCNEREPIRDDLEMILLTSGTTERPRLVPVTHGALLDVSAARAEIRELRPSDRCLSTAAGSFVVGISRTVEAVISGGSALVVNAADVMAFPAAIGELRPTWAWLGPALLESIVVAAESNPIIRDWPLRMVRCGGGHLRSELAAQAEALLGVPVLLGYGTTEVLGYIAAEEHIDRIPRKPGSVGQVRPGLEVAICSPTGEEVPLGETGEITVRDGRLFSGYLDDQEATAAAFFPGGWYRTGDLGRLDAEGYLFVTGRVREMINRGGEKIVPREIDDVLRAHPSVSDAAVFALPNARLGQDVAAAVVIRKGEALSARELRRWVAGQLAPHKTPRKIWFVAELPRTASGKVQRDALAEQFRASSG
jgi:acyl-coenzyme A synthetase/AMP-(fatty) acid ligase